MNRILISGGSRGIGAAIVRAFCKNGNAVAFLYLKSKEVADALSAETGAAAIQCDVSDPDAVRAAVADLMHPFIAKCGVLIRRRHAHADVFVGVARYDYRRSYNPGCARRTPWETARPHILPRSMYTCPA